MQKNIITAALGGRRQVTLTAIRYQHDEVQILRFTGFDLPNSYKVDFCNEGDAVTKPMTGSANGVQIPDEYLATGKAVKAYLVLSNTQAGADDVETVFEITIPVNRRPAPTDITPTPAEQLVIDELLGQLNEAVDEIEGMTASAETLDPGSPATVEKTVEDGSVHFMFGIPKGPQGDPGAPGRDGTSPTASVTKSGKTATITITDANGTTTAQISDGQDGADGQNGADGQDGVTPSFSIGTVTTGAAGTDASATITGTDAAPVLNLTIPRGDPGEVTEADLAEALLDKADVITDSASGAVAAFPDGMAAPVVGLTVGIEPVQDLHGYANPWPAGGGKNLLDPTYRTDTGQNIQLYFGVDLLLLKANTAYTFSVSVAAAQLTFLKRGGTSVAVNYGKTSLSYTPTEDMYVSLDVYYGGNFPVPSGGVSVVNCQLELGSTATSYAPYENICPITGHTAARVTRCGKNLIATPYTDSSIDYRGITGTANANGTVSLSGTATETAFFNLVANMFLKAGTYTISKSGVSGVRVCVINYATSALIAYGETSDASFTLTEDLAVKLYIRIASGTNISSGITVSPQLQVGSTATSYEPYTGQVYDIAFPAGAGTVYGGSLDVTTGVLTVDRAYALLSEESGWYEVSGNPRFRYSTAFSDRKKYGNSYDGLTNCSYIQINSLEYTNTGRWVSASADTFGIENDDLTLAQIQQDATDGKIVICYELATPVTYQLTPTEVSTLLGTNNVWADTGDTAVEYRADTKKYIDKKLAALVAQIVNS